MALFNHVKAHAQARIPEGAKITDTCRKTMEGLCHRMDWTVPEKLLISPANTPAVMVHWRVISAQLHDLDPADRDQVRHLTGKGAQEHPRPPAEAANKAPDSQVMIPAGYRRELRRSQEPSLPQAMDFHFHLVTGEISLDRTVGSDKWAKQKEVFRDLLRDACGTHALALLTVKEICNSPQCIHIHNFAGEPRTLGRWRQAFRHCYFSFSAMVADFDDKQSEALREVPLDQILPETDLPYPMPRPDQRYNTPAYIGHIAQEVVKHRGGDIKRLLYTQAYGMFPRSSSDGK
ncbi:uncharacterized protein [Ptychodera flava]|uniref:uncharacterized protein n=1 Tax=Ptychodera flava TaxID=63121 RepID=UPI00396A9BF7